MNDSAIYNADYKQTVEFYGAGGIFLRDAAEEVAACCGDEPFLPTPVPRTASGVNPQDGSSITRYQLIQNCSWMTSSSSCATCK